MMVVVVIKFISNNDNNHKHAMIDDADTFDAKTERRF